MLIEIGLAIGANFIIDFATRVFWRGTISTATTAYVIIAMVGLLLGFMSTMFWSYSMIRTEVGRILTVLLTPAVLGGLGALIGWIVTWRRSPLKLDTFIGGAIYGGSFALLRYLLTTHTI